MQHESADPAPRDRVVVKTSGGCSTEAADGENESFDEDLKADAEGDDAAYTAELIRDALRDIDQTDSVSQYERRLALREMKCVLQDAYSDRGEEPPAGKIKSYLTCDEHTETTEQFRVLRAEMMRILKETEQLQQRVRQLCSVLRSAWRSSGREPTPDLFTLAVMRGGKSLHPSRETLAVLEAMISALLVGATHTSSGVEVGTLRIRLRDLLVACSVPEAVAIGLCQDPQEGPNLRCAVARLEASLPQYKLLLDRVHTLRDPLAQHGPTPTYEAVEDFISYSEAALKQIRRWQSQAAAPFFVSKGEKLRFGVSVESVGGTESFTVILEAAVRNAGARNPCKAMR
jgi:hypothetical protein